MPYIHVKERKNDFSFANFCEWRRWIYIQSEGQILQINSYEINEITRYFYLVILNGLIRRINSDEELYASVMLPHMIKSLMIKCRKKHYADLKMKS